MGSGVTGHSLARILCLKRSTSSTAPMACKLRCASILAEWAFKGFANTALHRLLGCSHCQYSPVTVWLHALFPYQIENPFRARIMLYSSFKSPEPCKGLAYNRIK